MAAFPGSFSDTEEAYAILLEFLKGLAKNGNSKYIHSKWSWRRTNLAVTYKK